MDQRDEQDCDKAIEDMMRKGMAHLEEQHPQAAARIREEMQEM